MNEDRCDPRPAPYWSPDFDGEHLKLVGAFCPTGAASLELLTYYSNAVGTPCEHRRVRAEALQCRRIYRYWQPGAQVDVRARPYNRVPERDNLSRSDRAGGRMTVTIVRRNFVADLLGAVAWPMSARAQQPVLRAFFSLTTPPRPTAVIGPA